MAERWRLEGRGWALGLDPRLRVGQWEDSMREQFSTDEWQLLLDVPALVGTAVMVAGKSGLGTIKESFAIAQGILAGNKDHPESKLIVALVEARRKHHEKSGIETLGGPYYGMDANQLQQAALDKFENAGRLLREKTTPIESKAFSEWTIGIAEKVASAAKEGDFLGFGGTRVSETETQFLNLLRQRA